MRDGWWQGSSSPVLHGDVIFIVNDNDKESFMVAVDKNTGKQLWHIAQEKSNWSTPYVWQHDRTEIVTIGTIESLLRHRRQSAVGTGRHVGLVSQTPVAKHGMLYVGAGYHYGPLSRSAPRMGDISLKAGEDSAINRSR